MSRGRPMIPETDLRRELHRLRDELDRVPTSTDMNEHGEYSHNPYVARFDSWNGALRAVGFEPRNERATDEALIEDYRRVAQDLGRVPSKADLDEHGRWSRTTYIRNLGGMDKMAAVYLGITSPDIDPPELDSELEF